MEYVLPQQEQFTKKFIHKQTIELSEQSKSPQIFKWKTASIVLGSISAILVIIMTIVWYNLQSQPAFTKNLTFLSSIASQTQILQTNNNFQKIYGQTKFQKAIFLDEQLTHLSQINLRQIFYQQNQRLLFIFQIQSNDEIQTKFAIFMNSPFPMPKLKDFKDNITYYSFEINEQRKSSILSLNDDTTLTLLPSSPEIKSALECITYNLKTNKDQGISFSLLDKVIEFSLKNEDMKVNSQGYKCFTPALNQVQFEKKIQQILGKEINSPGLRFKKAQVYHLQ